MSNGNILLISLDSSTAQHTKRRLSELGYKVIEIDNLTTLPDSIEKSDPELCLVDIKVNKTVEGKKNKGNYFC